MPPQKPESARVLAVKNENTEDGSLCSRFFCINRPLLCSERRIWERYAELNDIKVRDRFDLDNALHFFRYNHSIRHILTLVYQAGQQEALHESFCRIMTPPDREMDALSTYREKFYAHGLYGLLDEWIKRDFRETPEEMVETIRQIVPGMGSGA